MPLYSAVGFLLTLLHIHFVCAEETVYFKEEFLTEDYKNRWVESTYKGSDQGPFLWSAGKYFKDAEKDKGLKTGTDAKFYGISAKFPTFSNKEKTLVIQFQVKHEQGIDCGGGYIKLLASDVDQKKFHGDTPYHIMFGPDICGMSTKKVHVIFTNKGKNHLVKREIACKEDELSHLYTLIVKPDNSYEVLIDNVNAQKGTIEEDFDILEPKTIPDPNEKKPDDWVDDEMMNDPDDKKPEDWDKPKTIPDPKAKKPEDWDSEMDGEWEPPQIDNPDYKGEWTPKQIKNPKYKGPWVHPEIDNPAYSPNPLLYAYDDIGAIGLDLWQVKAGTIFDNFLITDDPLYAHKYGEETWRPLFDEETNLKKKADDEEQKRMEEESKAADAKKDKPDDEKEDLDDDDEKDESEKKEDDKKDEESHDEL